ncbi:RUN and FYVE domain-containing protein 4 isoform X1 [Centrocercus urophasianus]|uniref:RUN and FYVE domain-containing protein 4 isoform X1 n=1 Tax=Centrocercus urophasianus TaxID=9002 RepID=UPI001C64E5DF|nr:RUN and FYVE domain-containing protein 4 isoform X1 [Centrocercus urophasianus]
MAGDGELRRVIKDLQKTIAELNRSYKEQNLPVTDGSRELHSLCAQLEFLLQFDLKEKKSFFGQRKDYWDFLCQGLAQRRQEHEGIRFVTSLDKLKTPVGRGRAFLRYCLVHRQLAESLQLCLLDPESLSEWYYARSPFLSPQRRAEILGSLYELDGITFHLALHRADLDTAWPMFSETLVRPSVLKMTLQTEGSSTGVHRCPDGIAQPVAVPHGMPAYPSPRAKGEEEDDVEAEENGEEDTEDNKNEEDNEKEEDMPSTAEAQCSTNADPSPTPTPDPGLTPGSPAHSAMEASLRAQVSQLRAELGRREEAWRAQLEREERQHRQKEECSTQQVRLWALEAEALRDTNAFLSRTLAEAAGGPGGLAQAQEEARQWREVAEERAARLDEAMAEVAMLTSRLQECQAAMQARGQTDAPAQMAALEEVLRRALELSHGPLMDNQEEGDPSTAAGMAMRLTALVTATREEALQSRQQIQALQEEVVRLQEQLSRARQDGERWASALQRTQREVQEREAMRGAEQARQQELIRDMKGRLLELLREKDALWQKTEGIDAPAPSPAPRDVGLCARCGKDFRLLSRRYSCRWAREDTGEHSRDTNHHHTPTICSLSRLCQGKVCHVCSMDMGKQGRCCLLCYQQRHPQAM